MNLFERSFRRSTPHCLDRLPRRRHPSQETKNSDHPPGLGPTYAIVFDCGMREAATRFHFYNHNLITGMCLFF
jgi:hypothetical protein